MNIITAIGNPKINEELKKNNFYNVIGVDIQYQDGVFEILDENKNINYLILNLDLIGNLNKYEFIEKIKEKNINLKIIIILEKEDTKLINYLFSKNIKNIIYKNEINIEKINYILKNKTKNKLKIKNKMTINKKLKKKKRKNKNIKNNLINKLKTRKIILRKIKNKIYKFKIIKLNKINIKNNYINNKKIIAIIGDRKSGKTIFTSLISKTINKKVLIISLLNNREINILFGIKNNRKEQFIKINKKVDLVKCNVESLKRKDFQNEIKKYKYIFFDTSDAKKEELENIIQISDKYILIIEPNLIGINNSKKIIDKILKINKKDLKIIINKNNFYSTNKNIIKYIFSDFKIIGKINYNNKYNFLINNNLRLIDLKIKKEYLKIIKEVECL